MTTSLNRWKGKVAVVTGASAGIGAATVIQLLEAGIKVVGLARRAEKIEELAKNVKGKEGKLYAYKADISVEDEILEAFKWIKENVGPVSILINNAGILRPTYLVDGDSSEWKKTLDTNVMGLAICTREAIKQMRDNDIDGHIVNVNSLAGHTVLPMTGLNMYSPSKFAVTSLTETLRYELVNLNSKIKVSSVSPGAVYTEILEANNLLEHFAKATKGLDVKTIPFLKSEDVADAILYILATPPHVLINELTIRPVGSNS